MANEFRMTGTWEEVNEAGEVVLSAGPVTDTTAHLCDALRKQALVLLGKKAHISYRDMTATSKTGAIVRFVGKLI